MEINSLMLLLRSEFQDKLRTDVVENETDQAVNCQRKWEQPRWKRQDRLHKETPQHKSDMGMRFPFEGLYAKPFSQEIFHSMPPFHLKKKKKNVSPFFSFSKIFMD